MSPDLRLLPLRRPLREELTAADLLLLDPVRHELAALLPLLEHLAARLDDALEGAADRALQYEKRAPPGIRDPLAEVVLRVVEINCQLRALALEVQQPLCLDDDPPVPLSFEEALLYLRSAPVLPAGGGEA